MSVSKDKLIEELRSSREYRESYAESFLNNSLTAQIRLIRDQRGLSQKDLAANIGKHQPGLSRIEDSNYGKWNVATLRQVASALDTWLKVSLEPYGKLVDAALDLSPDTLQRPTFEQDPVFAKRLTSAELLREEKTEGPIAELRRKLLPWLEESRWSPQRPIDWLQGRDLISYRHDDEPYRWFLRALPGDDPKFSWYRNEMVLRLAEMIEKGPEMPKSAPRPEEFLSNLFLLAAGLESPADFADPLYGVYRRLKRGALSWKNDDSVKDCLLAALTRNQRDARLYEMWLQMMETGRHDVLPGNEYAGFEGFKLLSPRPGIEEHALAIKLLEQLWKAWRDQDAVARLKQIMIGIGQQGHYGPGIADALLEAAFTAGWMQGALEALNAAFPTTPTELIKSALDPSERRFRASVKSSTLEIVSRREALGVEAEKDIIREQRDLYDVAVDPESCRPAARSRHSFGRYPSQKAGDYHPA
jgi:transcriptional regulator with XRE-family HTH domain